MLKNLFFFIIFFFLTSCHNDNKKKNIVDFDNENPTEEETVEKSDYVKKAKFN